MGSLAPTQIMRPWPLTCNPFGVCWCNGEFPSCVVMVCHACTSCMGALGIVFKKLLTFGQCWTKLLPHVCFNISIMVSNVCLHHIHGLLIYNHSHNGYMVSTNNNTWSTSVHISKNCLLVFKLIDCLGLRKWLTKLSLIIEVFQFKVHSLMTRRIEM